MIYRNKSELLETYEVKASFYYYHIEGIGDIKCRNVADIIRKEKEDSLIDAYIIMMNPGSCDCINADIKIVTRVENIPVQLEDAKSDPAQVCIMRLMDNLKFNRVRILNLSDITEPKSNIALNIMNQFQKNKDMSLSIFSKKRRKELEELTKQPATYIVSWGVSNELKEYKELAVKFIQNKKCIGIKKDNNDLLYYYIKPRTKEEQNKMIEKLSEKWKEVI